MSSIIEGYNYDIFISYRQKDNKYDGWVTEFVDNLKKELEATFKEEVSVYFDINPHDGLLETHDVDASLKEKLKCLVFIPIISRTYCDPKSFAWEHEFKAFVEQASQDKFGLKVKLPGGNVASRVLPVRIHDLDNDDIKLCESVLGGVMRGVEFIYKELGVNRSLLPNDHEEKNLNNTTYRNQINKVALAIKEVITAIRQYSPEHEEVQKEVSKPVSVPRKNRKAIIIAGSVIVLALIILGFLFVPKLFKPSKELEKSIAVLPFKLLSDKPDEQYLADGMMDAITLHLSKIKDLRVMSRTSVEQYRGTTKTTRQIGKELDVTYLLEGSFQKFGDDVKLIVQLIKAGEESHAWGNEYNSKWSEVFSLQSEVAQSIARELDAVITPEEKNQIEKTPTKSITAYDLLLKARNSIGMERFRLLEEALTYDTNFAAIYAEKGAWWLWYAGGWKGSANSTEVLANALPLITKALEIDPNNAEAHYGLAGLQIWYFWNFEASEKEYKIALQLDPLNAEIIHDYTDLLDADGRFEEALEWSNKGVKANPTTIWEKGLRQYFMNQYEAAIKTFENPISSKPDPNRYTEEARVRLYLGQYKNVVTIIFHYLKDFPEDRVPRPLGSLAIAYLKTGQLDSAQILLNEIKEKSQRSPAGSPSFYTAMIYAQMGEKDLAFEWLEKAFVNHEIEMYWLKVEPPFDPLRDDPRWQLILKKVGF